MSAALHFAAWQRHRAGCDACTTPDPRRWCAAGVELRRQANVAALPAVRALAALEIAKGMN